MFVFVCVGSLAREATAKEYKPEGFNDRALSWHVLEARCSKVNVSLEFVASEDREGKSTPELSTRLVDSCCYVHKTFSLCIWCLCV